MSNRNRISKLHFLAQKILPCTYDNSLSYYEWLCKVAEKCNEVVTTVNGVVDTVNALGDSVSELQTQVNGIASTISGIQTHLNNIDSNIGSLNGRVSNVESAINSIQGSLASIQGSVNSLTAELNTLSGTVAYHGRRISTLETSVSDLSDNITEIVLDITSLENSLATANENISALSENLDTAEYNISALQVDLGNLASTVSDNTSEIANNKTKITRAQADIFDLQMQTLQNQKYFNDIKFGKNLFDYSLTEGSGSGNVTVTNLHDGSYIVDCGSGVITSPTFVTIGIIDSSVSGCLINGIEKTGAYTVLEMGAIAIGDFTNTFIGTVDSNMVDYGTIGTLSSGSYFLKVRVASGASGSYIIKPMIINKNFPNGGEGSVRPEEISSESELLKFVPFIPKELPNINASDEGKVLTVLNGVPTWVELPSFNGGSSAEQMIVRNSVSSESYNFAQGEVN